MSEETESERKLVEKIISHPVEELFDIEPNSTAVMVPEPRSTELVEATAYDNKDSEIEENFQEIYDKAMDAFDDMQGDIEGVEGKYKARNTEVSVMMLNAALSAAKEKANLKKHKDTIRLKSGQGTSSGTVTNNTIITTAELVAQLAEKRSPVNNQIPDEIVEDAQVIEQEPEPEVKPKRKKMQRKKSSDAE